MKTVICTAGMIFLIVAALHSCAAAPTKAPHNASNPFAMARATDAAQADLDDAIDAYLRSITRSEREYQRLQDILGDTVLEGYSCEELTAKGELSPECKSDLRSQVAIERAI